MAQLADAMTKTNNRKILLHLFGRQQQPHQRWRLVHDEKFESGRRVHKKELERRLKEMQNNFVAFVKELAEKRNFAWTDASPYT